MDELFDVFDEQPNGPLVAAAALDSPASITIAPSANSPASKSKSSKRSKRDKKDKSKKRKADGHMKNGNADGDLDLADGDAPEPSADDADADADADAADDEPDDAENPQDPKRRKKQAEANPVMADNFTTAESREIDAAAGFAPSKELGSLTLAHNIQHQVALPPDLDYDYVPLSSHKAPAEPARTYKFKLDPFQSLSVASIERDESVLVSAHTSAGKTVVAEYAIAQCLKRTQRVIYTSPIKALSNQKYRDFLADFGDVGLMTGDVTINPTASCLVMTTEILRSMLYRGSEIMREVAWVIFDEVHYLRDKTRGVVWEETIILLPDKVRYVFLSATIPNAFQFAEWIAKIHRQACHVVYTDFRPTPLQSYFFPAGGDGMFLIVDEKGNFREETFAASMASIEAKKGADPSDPMAAQKGKGKHKKTNKGGRSDSEADINKMIKMIMRKQYHPVIVFNFSKRECEEMALKISNMTFNNADEKIMVTSVFENALATLSEEDRTLPQLTHILPLLQKGIGVHHSGLLPILKETIEILFQEGLIKALFATETFSIGLNMPARTVVFSQVKKFDGKTLRPLTVGEYIQMSGRAGRRGLDDRGIVIMMLDDKLEPEAAREMVAGQQDKLNSAFHLGYNMILNLLRIETISPEFMLERCFYQFQNNASVPALEKDMIALQQEKDNMVIPDETTIKEYYTLRNQLEDYTKDMISVIQHPNYCTEFLQPGRLVQIKTPSGDDFDWGVIISFTRRRSPGAGEPSHSPQESIFIDVLLRLDGSSGSLTTRVHPTKGVMPPGIRPFLDKQSQDCRYEVVPVLLTCVKAFGQIRLFVKGDLKTEQEKETCGKNLEEAKRRFPDGIPILDPIENMGIHDDSFKKLMRKIEVLEAKLLSNPLHNSSRLPELWEQFVKKATLSDKIKGKKKAIAKAHSISQLDELKARKRVLRRLGFINEAEVVQMKARVACEIGATEGHELLISELLFNGYFNDLAPEVCASVLSVFIFDERVDATELKENLAKPYREIQAQARVIAKVSQESKLEVNEEEYVQSLKWQLMETVHVWAQGRPFLEICKMTSVYEGSLIRLFRRLEELLRQLAQAVRVMGSEELCKKFEDALNLIKRDIVATNSLYI